jgi:hypothetical protein
MYSVLNCHNVVEHAEFYLGKLWFNVTSTGNAGVSKRALQWFSKCYFLASVKKTFTLKGVQTLHRSTP